VPAARRRPAPEASVEVAARVVATLLRFARVLEAPADPRVLACAEHRALSRRAAVQSMVLLRNDGALLPLDPSRLRRLAVIGRLAATPNLGDGGSSNVHPPEAVTPLDGLRAALPAASVVYDDGGDAARVAAGADAAVVVVGYTRHDEGEYIDPAGVAHLFHLFPPMTDAETGARLQAAMRRASDGHGMSPGGDRRRLELSAADEALVRAVAAANPRTIVVVMSGSTVVMEGWRTRVPAIVQLWYPGMEGGHALADVLLGAAEAGGRLPFAIPTSADHLPDFDPDATAITYDPARQWKPIATTTPPPIRSASVSRTRRCAARRRRDGDGSEGASAVVANTGRRDGAEAVQVYGGVPASSTSVPAGGCSASHASRCRRARARSRSRSRPDARARRGGRWYVSPAATPRRRAPQGDEEVALEIAVPRGSTAEGGAVAGATRVRAHRYRRAARAGDGHGGRADFTTRTSLDQVYGFLAAPLRGSVPANGHSRSRSLHSASPAAGIASRDRSRRRRRTVSSSGSRCRSRSATSPAPRPGGRGRRKR
jgi:hypothetical protein